MKVVINKNTHTEDELRRILEGKSIYEMTVWTRDHAQYLKWFCGFSETKIEAILQPFMQFSFFLYQNFKDDATAISEFREICIKFIVELETTCQ